jgi:Uma2 family endonuclease
MSPAEASDIVVPGWMRQQVTAAQYDCWSHEQRVGIEIVDGMAQVTPVPTAQHGRLVRQAASALQLAAGQAWVARTGSELHLASEPLSVRLPDVVLQPAGNIAVLRPADVLLVVEIVAAGTETTDAVTKLAQYANARIPFYWRVEPNVADVPFVYTYALDPATGIYEADEVFVGFGAAVSQFPSTATHDLGWTAP